MSIQDINTAETLRNARPGYRDASSLYDPETEALRLQSGLINAKVGYNNERDDDQREEDKREKETMKAFAEMTREMQSLTFGGITLSYRDVLDDMQYGIERKRKQIEASENLPEISKDQMLYVDRNGQLVDAGTVGARAVRTVEEKIELGDRNKLCLAKMTTEEVTLDGNGRLVDALAFKGRLSDREQMDELSKAFKDVEEGRISLNDLPDNLKQRVVELEHIKQDDPFMKNTEKNMLEILQDQAAMSKFAPSAQPQQPVISGPSLDYTLANGPKPPVMGGGF